jgi:hypothetical protein
MRHVSPHRWADAWAGKLTDDEVAEMDRHAEACARCAKARDRITRTSSTTFPALRTESAPDVGWDAVRAKVYWTVSTERRAKQPARRRWIVPVLAAGSVAVVAVIGLIGPRTSGLAPRSEVAIAPPPQVGSPTPEAPAAPAGVTGLVSRMSGDVMIDGLRQGAFERTLATGSLIATGDGRVDVQFGDASALALGPKSSLQLRRFDAEAIELVVDGTLDVVVAPRAPGQRFLVVAGDETVEVRGTQFRVARDARGVRVSCRHGLVAVRDGTGEVQIGAAHQAVIAPGRANEAHAVTLGDPELAQLAAATPVTLPLWTTAVELGSRSAPLDIAATTARDVRVDGVEMGAAPLRVRVMPGRHTVEAADRSGRYRRAGWVDVSTQKIARLEVQPVEEVVPTSGTAERQKQLHAAIDRGKLYACTRALSKEGIAGAFVQLEIAVDATGAVNYLNALDSDLGAAGQDCVLGILRQVRFAPGPAASWRERIDL